MPIINSNILDHWNIATESANKNKILHSKWLSCVIGLVLLWWAVITHAEQSYEYHYRYISFSQIALPSGFAQFTPVAIDDKRQVYGDIFDSSGVAHVAVYGDGVLNVFQPGNVLAVNTHGTIGGYITDPQTGNFQAALFRGNEVEIIPLLPGETKTLVQSLNDSDTALVRSEGSSALNTYRLYKKGKTLFSYQLPTESDCSRCWGINNEGTVVGTIFDPNLNAFRAIRFQPPYDKSELLNPFPTDSDTTSFGISKSGSILGLSNIFLGDLSKNHYGIWDRQGNFKSYFEGINYFALFNNKNLIVLTQNFDTDNNSYLVPHSGVRLNIMDLLDNPADADVQLSAMVDINNYGDMTGFGCTADFSLCGGFLLQRVFSDAQ